MCIRDSSEDDYRTGCRNVIHCQQQQFQPGLRSPGRSNSTYFYIFILYIYLYIFIHIFSYFPPSAVRRLPSAVRFRTLQKPLEL